MTLLRKYAVPLLLLASSTMRAQNQDKLNGQPQLFPAERLAGYRVPVTPGIEGAGHALEGDEFDHGFPCFVMITVALLV